MDYATCVDRQAKRCNIKLDESYFGGKHHNSKRGRGAENKIPVFGILKRNGKVYTQIIPNSSAETLLDIVQTKIKPDSIVYYRQFQSLQ